MSPKKSKYIVVAMLVLALIAMIMCIYSCASPEKIAIKKAKKQNEATLKHIQLLREARKAFPCDTNIISITTESDTTSHKPDTVYSDMGRIIYRDRTIENTVNHTIYVRDRAAEEEKSDSINALMFQYTTLQNTFNEYVHNEDEKTARTQAEIKQKDEKIAELKPWKNKVLLFGGILGAACIAIIVLKIKKFFI